MLRTSILIAMLLAATAVQAGIQSPVDQQKISISKNLTSMPLAFTENQGQWNEQVKYRADAGGATMWFTTDGVYYQFTRRIATDDAQAPDDQSGPGRMPNGRDHEPDSVETMLVQAAFVGANANAEIVAEGLMEYRCNYFLGDDPTKWRTDVPNYEAITLRNVYDGVDLEFFGGAEGRLTYRYELASGVDISQIDLAYKGIESVSTDDEGRALADTRFGEIAGLLAAPAGKAQSLAQVAYGGDAGAEMPTQTTAYSSSGTVVLIYGTYLGGSDWDGGRDISVDGSGNAYVTGFTMSSDFPTEGEYQTKQRKEDAFVTKLNSTGNALVYSTYLGGRGRDMSSGLSVDGSGNAYISGFTTSSDFPTEGEYQADQGGADAFVTKLNSTGNVLVYSTYLGGSGFDVPVDLSIDGSGSAYVTGWTYSHDFPTEGEYQADQDTTDAFVTKLNSTGNALVYSTYLGGNSHDWAYNISVDGSGNAHVTGRTASSDFPTEGEYQTHQGGEDVFVAKLNSTGNGLVYSTYLGGSGDEGGGGIAVDGSGNAYVTGSTESSDFPTVGEYQTDQDTTDAFVTKLNSTGNALVYSTYLGGGEIETGNEISVDGSGNAYVTGKTESSDFPTEGEYQSDQGALDAFVTKLSYAGNALVYSTYLGGGTYDCGYDIEVDGSGTVYVTGDTWSSDFPTEGDYQTRQGEQDAFVIKFTEPCALVACGDTDCNGELNEVDLQRAFDIYIGVSSSWPSPVSVLDMDCDGVLTIADVVILAGYIHGYGPTPCCAPPPKRPDLPGRGGDSGPGS